MTRYFTSPLKQWVGVCTIEDDDPKEYYYYIMGLAKGRSRHRFSADGPHTFSGKLETGWWVEFWPIDPDLFMDEGL
jgi:hypothetical protein